MGGDEPLRRNRRRGDAGSEPEHRKRENICNGWSWHRLILPGRTLWVRWRHPAKCLQFRRLYRTRSPTGLIIFSLIGAVAGLLAGLIMKEVASALSATSWSAS